MDRTIADGGWKARMPTTFPLILGSDLAGVVEAVGEGASRFVKGDEVFGQLLIAPLGSTGTYAEYVAVAEDAPLARVPSGLDPAVAAALPTGGGSALEIIESLGFAALASLVRPGGTALTTRYVADTEALASREVTGVNYRLSESTGLLERLADAVVSGRIVVPPITHDHGLPGRERSRARA